MKETTGTTNLSILYKDFAAGKIVLPYFQRAYRWTLSQEREWGKSIVSEDIISQIFTYQIEPIEDSPIFLCDGFQRMSATHAFLSHPERWKVSREQALHALEECQVGRVHRHYDSHEQAFAQFQRIQNATPVTLREWFAGLLNSSHVGKHVSDGVPQIVIRCTSNLTKYPSSAYSRQVYERDALALFWQFISGYKGRSFWNAGSVKLPSQLAQEKKSTRYIEQELVDGYGLHDKAMATVQSDMDRFENYLWMIVRFVEQRMVDTGQSGKFISPTTLRALLHLYLYFKNNDVPVAKSVDFFNSLLSLWKTMKRIGGHVGYFMPDGTQLNLAIRLDVVRDIETLPVAFGIPLFNGHREHQSNSRNGEHASHILPYATNGNGKTVAENGLENLARGMKPMFLEGDDMSKAV